MTDDPNQVADPEDTRRESNAVHPDDTRREIPGGPESGAVGTRREGMSRAYVRVNLPPELAAVFDVVGEVASGGESDVLLVERRDGSAGRRAALKIYRHGLEPEPEALAAIMTLPREHVVEIYDCGRSTAGWWEEQEYIEHGSLADLFAAEGPKLNSSRLSEMLVELTNALDAVHPVLHRDVKPTNIFVRTVEPLDLVLGDFGLARSTAFTHIVSTVAGSLAYQSPEALDGGASVARDWWAVGMIVAEGAIGRHPFHDPELGWPPVAEMRIALTTRPVPLDGIDDERVRLLCRGLLARDPRRRWGASQIRSWLDGESPPVADEPAVRTRSANVQPFIFAGERAATPEALAPLLAQHWDEALRLVSGAASQAPDYVRLAVWLQEHDDRGALRVLEQGALDRSFARRLFRLLRILDPSLPPSFRGCVVDRQGLVAVATAAATGDEQSQAIVYDLYELGIIGELAREDAFADLISVEERWRTQSELLASLAQDIGEAAAPLQDENVKRLTRARILYALLDESELSQIGGSVTTARNGLDLAEHDSRVSQFDQIVGDATEPARILTGLLFVDFVADTLARERAEASERDARVRTDRAEAERAERERAAEAVRVAARQRLARMARFDRRIARSGVLVAATLVGPWLLGRYVWRRHLYTSTLVLPWPHPSPGFFSLFLPEVIFGIGVVAAAVGLLLLRPPWPQGRGPRLAAAAVLIVAGVLSPLVATGVAKSFIAHTRRAFHTGPIDVKALGGNCGRYYWTSHPGSGGVVDRWFIYPASQCKTLVLYHGWRQAWHLRAPAGASFRYAFMYGTNIVTEEAFASGPNELVGVQGDNGRVVWRWHCPYSGSTAYHDLSASAFVGNNASSGEAKQIEVPYCGSSQIVLDPLTGRRLR